MANIIHSKHFTNYVVIAIGYVMATFSLIYNIFNNNYLNGYEYGIGYTIAQLSGIYLLVQSGTFKKTRYYRLARIGIAVIIISVLFKVLHFYGSEIAMITGFAVISLCYTLSFLNKPYKKMMDWLKLLYVITLITHIVCNTLHIGLGEYFQFHGIIMLILVIIHINEQRKLGYPEDVNDTFKL
ncbi:hypothetical protein [Nonlabens sp.]|uniref:hypothetical protein n=1 Tax=Nonlabens sp. TaxID=1888209 RepID=UPI003F698597